jgi:pimeloyl-ACP methyl ester carboxylesterase
MPPMFEQMYAAVSPDGPDHFRVIFDKLKPTWQAEPSKQLDELSRVAAPTLVLAADDDVVTIEHAAAMQRALPDAQLAVVPGTSHALPMEKPEIVNRLILDFLASRRASAPLAAPCTPKPLRERS